MPTEWWRHGAQCEREAAHIYREGYKEAMDSSETIQYYDNALYEE